MSKRSYPSGAEKKKKAAHQKEAIGKLPKLTAFFTPETPAGSKKIDPSNSPLQQDTEKTSELISGSGNDEHRDGTTPTTDLIKQVQDLTENISQDPGDYCDAVFTEQVREIWIRKGPAFFQNKDCDFSEASRTYTEFDGRIKTRNLHKTVFIRRLKNNESVERKWLLYSPLKRSVFCYSCCLFSASKTSFNSLSGCNDWKHINNLILEHENSLAHRQSMMTYIARSKIIGRVDVDLLSQYKTEVDYWKSVLKRIVAVIKFLASRGLAFRGDNETFGSQNNGNYLGCMELLSEFDPFLADHIKKYGNLGKGNTSYLSANICNEFIDIMGKKVLMTIVSELKTAKYYSISVDSTPDLSHIDQLTFIVRYVKDGVPVERFIQFLPIKEHKAEYLAETVLRLLENYGVSIKDCRG
ncbi:zinc finger MYM-type protein 1-like [Diprion similis]|uniref:zinc finger MYM-type protein 1-like n=1 Tax=Diprion similis TaxID=362088 RepID=UPI001EF97339|nr:zinc finger MYM-type protein 1-like [Diprion similis]